MRIRNIFFISFIAISLSACSWSNFPFLYKPDIQQGNVLPEDRVAQVKVGMNKDEVNYLLGNPILVNVIDSRDTQYIYTFKPGKGDMTTQKLILTFNNDKLVQIARSE